MPFRSGTVSYARFRVEGGPAAVDDDLVGALAANTLKPPSVGAPPEVQAGWVAGRHVFDTDFTPETVCFGDALLLGVRVDTNKVPAEIRRAYRALAQAAAANGDGESLRAGASRREIIEEAEDRCRSELAAGRHRRSKMIPVLWDVPAGLVLAPVFSDTASAVVRELFEATFGAQLEPSSAGMIARDMMAARGRSRDYEDLVPSAFTPPPAAAHGEEDRDVRTPSVPWAHIGQDTKDYLGNEFIFWLWSQLEQRGATFSTPAGEIALGMDRVLDLHCAWDVTGTTSMRAAAPARLPEAGKAVQLGKWPRKVGLLLAGLGEQWELTFQGDRFLVTAAKMPRPQEPPASPREHEEARVGAVIALDRCLVGLYQSFIEARTGPAWTAQREAMRLWIGHRGGRPAATAETPVTAEPPAAAGATNGVR